MNIWKPNFSQQSKIFDSIAPYTNQYKDYTDWPTLADYNHFNQTSNIKFVPQATKPKTFSEHYEPRIYLKGEVQTREHNWHDFFNMLIWQQFPQAKKQLNQYHYNAHKQRYPQQTRRSNIENILTLFDENGVVVLSTNKELLELLKTHQWTELFWQRRQQVQQQMQYIIFGHALYEKALNPFIGITGKGILIHTQQFNKIDSQLTNYLTDKCNLQSTKQLHPIPILGIPGWYPENNTETFYNNTNYFRSLL